MTRTEQDQLELEVFDDFTRSTAPYIEEGTRKKLDPPAPDILCQLKDGRDLAFELVELLDRGFHHKLSFSIELHESLHEYCDGLSDEDRGQLAEYQHGGGGIREGKKVL